MRLLPITPFLIGTTLLLAACQTQDASGAPGTSPQGFDDIGEDETIRFTGTEPFWGGSTRGDSLTYQIVTGRAAIWMQPKGPFGHPSISDLALHSASQQNITRLRSKKIDAAIARLGRARSDKDIRAAHCAFEAVKTEVLPYLPVKRGVIGLITRNDIGGVALTGDPVIGYHRMFRK